MGIESSAANGQYDNVCKVLEFDIAYQAAAADRLRRRLSGNVIAQD